MEEDCRQIDPEEEISVRFGSASAKIPSERIGSSSKSLPDLFHFPGQCIKTYTSHVTQVDEALVSAQARPSEPLPPTTNGAFVTENGVTEGDEVRKSKNPGRKKKEKRERM